MSADPAYDLYDYYGNPVAATDGKFVLPLNAHGYFLRGKGQSGSFAKLVAAVKTSKISGIGPVEIVAHDMIAPIGDPNCSVRLTVTNVLNRPITGTVNVNVAGLTLSPADRQVEFDANQTKDIVFPVTAGRPAPTNTYALSTSFKAPIDGSVNDVEDLHCNVIAHRTINIDRNMSE